MIATLPSEIAALFPFEPHWADVAGYRLHYVDEGPRDAPAVVLMHGNPTWAFVYREFIPRIVEAGFRVIAPDYLGFGRSDHARVEAEYAIEHHAARTLAVLDVAAVRRAVFFVQDWGGPIGLGICTHRRGILKGLVVANTFWGEASTFQRGAFPWRTLHAPVSGALLLGRRRMFVNALRLSGPPSIHDGPAWDAYRLPFEAHGGPGGTLAFPRAISMGPGHPTQPLADAIWAAMPAFDVPTRFIWGEADAVFPWAEQGVAMRERLPRGASHEPVLVKGARHFVQEYGPAECADLVIEVAREAYA